MIFCFLSLESLTRISCVMEQVELLRTPAARLGVDLIVAKTADVPGSQPKTLRKESLPSPHLLWIFCSLMTANDTSSHPSTPPKNIDFFCKLATLRSLLMVERVGQGGLVEASFSKLWTHKNGFPEPQKNGTRLGTRRALGGCRNGIPARKLPTRLGVAEFAVVAS